MATVIGTIEGTAMGTMEMETEMVITIEAMDRTETTAESNQMIHAPSLAMETTLGANAHRTAMVIHPLATTTTIREVTKVIITTTTTGITTTIYVRTTGDPVTTTKETTAIQTISTTPTETNKTTITPTITVATTRPMAISKA